MIKILAILLLSFVTFSSRPTDTVHAFFKIDPPEAVVAAQPIESKVEVQKPVTPAPVQPPAPTPVAPPPAPTPPPANCRPDQWVRADNGQCKDKPQATQRAAVPQSSASVPGCGDNSYANFIYMHESGCRPGAVNSIGCRGIGQACPGSKLPCGADYACQNAYFTNYAMQRYGSWEKAYQFWISHKWW